MSLIDEYLTHGWNIVPIPHGTKGPRHAGWNTRAGALVKAEDLPPDYGVGLMHAYNGTMSLDVDDWELTKSYGVDVDTLASAPDAVHIVSGKPNRGKLLYRAPFGIVLPSKQFKVDGRLAFELRCGTVDGTTTQCVLPPSIHPETGQPYTWGGAGHWTHLPWLPPQLLRIWEDSIKDIRPPSADGVDSSWEEITDALKFIDPSCSRDEWFRVGMALQWAGEQTWNADEAFRIWNEWSACSPKYRPHEMTSQWRSFSSNKSQLVTLGTLFNFARKAGWVRPIPDASELFGSTMVRPEDIIHTLRPSPPDIDLSLWPSVLTTRAREVSDSVGCDPLVPLWAGLSAVCGVIDAQTRLELMPGFKVPPVLWLMTIGDPGDRKSPGSRPMLSAIKDIEASDRQRYAQAKQEWAGKEATWAAAQKAYLLHCGSEVGLLDPTQAPHVPMLPDEPVPLKIAVSDITSQALVYQSKGRPRGLLCHLDEMNSWVYKINNGASGENRSAWVVAYESERYQMDRAGSGETHCENFAVSIYGNMQPQVLSENFSKLTNDGLLQRFLPCVLRHNQTRIGQPVPEFLSSATTWENTLRLTFAHPPKTYRLSPDAYTVFRAFQEWYEDRMHSERLARASNEFLTAFGKITGLAGRLILLFHTIESPFSDTVDADIVRRVVRIVREFIVPTYRYVFDGDGSMSAFDQWVIEYIIQHADLERITLSDLKHSARRQFERAKVTSLFQQNEWTIGAMYLLEQMGWVARVDNGSQEGRGQAEWLINPHLKTTFTAYRKAVVQAKVAQDIDILSKAGPHRTSAIHGRELLDCI